ncbi:MAG: 16S rRNA methyltransferase [Nitrososphaerota archaeon]|nr:16S rRNA methyltransferase [Candidatus Bathyarchaeota archaeon]MDW8048521.1 16S rRNA methyltransferase [Nitrososphaerota archaeon]
MLTIILAESALEPVPEELWDHPGIRRYSKKRGKHPSRIILDRSYHHSAMKRLANNEKRGRPDIVHFCLLEALNSPLNREGLLKIYVHTYNDYIIHITPHVRLPRNQNRFIGLMEQLFEYGKVPIEGSPLLILEKMTLRNLLNTIKPSSLIAFTRMGQPLTLEETLSEIDEASNLATIIGGFPSGHFSSETLSLAHRSICIDPETLEAWTVTSRLVYEYERRILLPSKRLSKIKSTSKSRLQ